ncbi:hypothetical protein RRG08_009079 [Elysia crispata]|uniref:Uncharacterized protein n=1 Tax=Elysia crispata TaxID=231223 RepID=A0AAE0Y7S4_9GAST|nr:hypothetical protein RRG08_009079 [Elysia crispata]
MLTLLCAAAKNLETALQADINKVIFMHHIEDGTRTMLPWILRSLRSDLQISSLKMKLAEVTASQKSIWLMSSNRYSYVPRPSVPKEAGTQHLQMNQAPEYLPRITSMIGSRRATTSPNTKLQKVVKQTLVRKWSASDPSWGLSSETVSVS